MRKFITIFFIVMLGMVFSPNAFAGDKADCIYKSNIDQAIAFYEGRLYLIDSEYKILADIGKEAKAKINYLSRNENQLIQEMKNQRIGFSTTEINGFICQQLKNNRMIGLGYTKAEE